MSTEMLDHTKTNPFAMLHLDDQQHLVLLNQKIHQVLQSPYVTWDSLDDFVLGLYQSIDFARIIEKLPLADSYYRIPISQEFDGALLTLFVFRLNQYSSAVLLHLYENNLPNRSLFAADACLSVEGAMQTPVHNHQGNCHSCVAHITGGAKVIEQSFTQHAGKLQLQADTPRKLYSCNLDASDGEAIHRICVSSL